MSRFDASGHKTLRKRSNQTYRTTSSLSTSMSTAHTVLICVNFTIETNSYGALMCRKILCLAERKLYLQLGQHQ